MRFPTTLALGLFGIAIGSPLRSGSELSALVVSVAGPAECVTSVHDLKFSASVTNHGPVAAKILKYETILDDKLPTKSFAVTKDGKEVEFTGIKLITSIEDADDTAYVLIKPGETVTVTHRVAELFDFATAGAGKYTFSPITNFVLRSGSVFFSSSGLSHPVEVEISSNVLPVFHTESHERRAKNSCNQRNYKAFIDHSYTEAKLLAEGALTYLDQNNGAEAPLFKAYFGSGSVDYVKSLLTDVANEDSTSRTFFCNSFDWTCSTTSALAAYTNNSGNIQFCNFFFSAFSPTSSLCKDKSLGLRRARGGLMLHELTHSFSGRAQDKLPYSECPDKKFTDQSDDTKIRNAENYQCFVTEIYRNEVCK